MQSNITDPARKVTEQDVLGAIVSLGALPKRASETAELDLQAYCMAMMDSSGNRYAVCAADLASAVRAVLQGSLGHAFFPSPPELRIECDASLEVKAAEAERQQRRKRAQEERASFGMVEHTPEQKARVSQIYQRFLDGREQVSAADELTQIRSKYDEQQLNEVPDRPLIPSWMKAHGSIQTKAMFA